MSNTKTDRRTFIAPLTLSFSFKKLKSELPPTTGPPQLSRRDDYPIINTIKIISDEFFYTVASRPGGSEPELGNWNYYTPECVCRPLVSLSQHG